MKDKTPAGSGAPPLAHRLFRTIDHVLARGGHPVVVLDVDLTLLDTRPRTRKILADYLHARPMDLAARRDALDRLWCRPLRFSIVDNLRALGIEDDEIRAQALPFWKTRFFSGPYCALDVPLAGAPEACRALHAAGATLVYASARHARTMAAATVQTFLDYGIPVATAGAVLALKEDPDEPDGAFKARVADHAARMGTVVAAADNEPGHCNVFRRRLPEAIVAWVDTAHHPGAPPLDAGIAPIAGVVDLVPEPQRAARVCDARRPAAGPPRTSPKGAR